MNTVNNRKWLVLTLTSAGAFLAGCARPEAQVTTAVLFNADERQTTDASGIEMEDESQTQDASKSENVVTFEGTILLIDDDGFLLRVDGRRRFVQIPDEATVFVLDDQKRQVGQVATVIAVHDRGEYVAKGIIVRPKEPA